jgi:hypothetical protein
MSSWVAGLLCSRNLQTAYDVLTTSIKYSKSNLIWLELGPHSQVTTLLLIIYTIGD